MKASLRWLNVMADSNSSQFRSLQIPICSKEIQMRKSMYAIFMAGIFGFSTAVLADAQTQDSTNTYSPASQEQEKLHQKPLGNDAENADSNTRESRPHTRANKSDAQRDLEDRAAQKERENAR
jgi:hypothetical protein